MDAHNESAQINPARMNPSSHHPMNSNLSHQCSTRKQHEPTQNTIWGFVHRKLPRSQPAPTPTLPNNTPAITASPNTQSLPNLTPRGPLAQVLNIPTSHQRPLIPDKTNAAWGDAHQYTHPNDSFHVMSKNVSMLNPRTLDMTAIVVELQASKTSVFLAQETNTVWKLASLHAIQSQCNRIHRHSKLATSSSQDSQEASFQPGGTLTLALGKWASRVIQWGNDKPLGRWSYLEFVGQHGMQLIVVSVYRVCAQPFDATTITATTQQT